MNNRQYLDELLLANQRRLQVLKLQAAKYGVSAPPHILIEIEDIQEEIASINLQIGEIEKSKPTIIDKGISVVSRPYSILFLAADPTNATRLRLGEELREIQEKLQLAKLRDQFTLEQRMSVRPADISQALLDVQPEIVHFSGHGANTGELCFENQIGETHPIQPDALAALFEQFATQVKCVLLNACYSQTQANVIAKHIDYVIGMNKTIGDKAAIVFAIGFYQALGAGRTIEEAYKLGCVQIRLQGIPEHLTPVLIQEEAT
ncbi:MAG: CHAT domain-containing protein [Proteobacteria bacterium]|nr:CHAT domain-containing protein [Pseudomonadota bacterium]